MTDFTVLAHVKWSSKSWSEQRYDEALEGLNVTVTTGVWVMTISTPPGWPRIRETVARLILGCSNQRSNRLGKG